MKHARPVSFDEPGERLRGHLGQPAQRLHGRDGNMPDYERWSIEELRAFAKQLQLPDSMRKNRGELLEMLGGGSRRA